MNRRSFLAKAGIFSAALPFGAENFDFNISGKNGFSFMLLGDLHFDKLEHHDMKYVQTRYPNDIVQIENYSRITKENFPLLMKLVREKGRSLNADFYLQLGDFVEGLCGSAELANKQVTEFIDYVRELKLRRPFAVVKGNHDITGEGAPLVYDKKVIPWQRNENKKADVFKANATFVHKNARFLIFDCYDAAESLEWAKGILEKNKQKLVFFCLHQPVVPYNARSNWHIFARPEDVAKRNELLGLLGKHRAIVLTAHLHKTSIVRRDTPEGSFVQLAIGSVVSRPDDKIKHELSGVNNYTSRLTELEPGFSPASLEERKKLLAEEKPFISHFEYADFCGYATMSIDEADTVSISIYPNVDRNPWKTINITELLKGQAVRAIN